MTPTATKTPMLILSLARLPDPHSIVAPAWKAFMTAFDLVFDAPAVVARVREMQALLEEAEHRAATDPMQARRLRARAAVLAAS
jgi:hypothetical protein